MPFRGSVFAKDHYYHIFNRGAGRGRIFFNSENYEYLIRLLKHYSPKYGAKIITYCLMPNHYHFLIQQETDQALSKFINVLFNTYVQSVNRQQHRSGTLFEGRFHHICIDHYEYLVHLCRYIHCNPRKAGLVENLADWPYSNYLDWVGMRNSTLKDDEFIDDQFPGGREVYRQFVDDLVGESRARPQIAKYVWD